MNISTKNGSDCKGYLQHGLLTEGKTLVYLLVPCMQYTKITTVLMQIMIQLAILLALKYKCSGSSHHCL